MPAVHDKTAGADGDEVLERRLDPIFCLDRVEADVPRDVAARGESDEFADRGFVGRLGEMHGDAPAPAGPLERGDRCLALEKTLVQEIDDALCGLLAADRKAGACGAGGEGGSHQGSGKLCGRQRIVLCRITYPLIGWRNRVAFLWCLKTPSGVFGHATL